MPPIDCTSPRRFDATVDPPGAGAELDLEPPQHVGQVLKVQPDPAPALDPELCKRGLAGTVAAFARHLLQRVVEGIVPGLQLGQNGHSTISVRAAKSAEDSRP